MNPPQFIRGILLDKVCTGFPRDTDTAIISSCDNVILSGSYRRSCFHEIRFLQNPLYVIQIIRPAVKQRRFIQRRRFLHSSGISFSRGSRYHGSRSPGLKVLYFLFITGSRQLPEADKSGSQIPQSLFPSCPVKPGAAAKSGKRCRQSRFTKPHHKILFRRTCE